MILKAFHFAGELWRFLWCRILLLTGRYDRKYCKSRHFRGGFRAEGWSWMYHDWKGCLIHGVNSGVPWPVTAHSKVAGWERVCFDPDDLHNFQSKGCYIQAAAPVTIGKGTYIACNVGIITANHDPEDIKKHTEPRPVKIGESCWIGMNSVLLPGVELGQRTVVGAGSVVTHSFPEGHCIIAGNPAREIRTLVNEKEQGEII